MKKDSGRQDLSKKRVRESGNVQTSNRIWSLSAEGMKGRSTSN